MLLLLDNPGASKISSLAGIANTLVSIRADVTSDPLLALAG